MKRITVWMVVSFVVLVVALLIFFLVEMSPRLTYGQVIDKRHDEAYTSVWGNQSSSESGMSGDIRTYRHEATWQIRVNGTHEGKARAEWWSVGSGIYDSVSLGDFVVRDARTGAVRVEYGAKD